MNRLNHNLQPETHRHSDINVRRDYWICLVVEYPCDYPKNPLLHKFDKENIFGNHKVHPP